MITRLWTLLRDAFVEYPDQYGIRPGRAKAMAKILELSSQPRPLKPIAQSKHSEHNTQHA